ncbi:dentin sialophosphoprotein-like [Dorcoceras hygrometricum]|uniref:Dentin sialophosphoprotein-like n=1 Tax=Dorcoceras hygrometricum TaxID=472368 RepID=A0A2Z7BIP7_9LAMI|nr:dentin sialophosphoprotein-like [Dorcoceras hygrometricum]
MATKSDFAQKLLHDLRVRKERMAATQNSNPRPSQRCRDTQGNPRQTYRGARQINGYDSSRAGNLTRRSGGGTKPIGTVESSNQIVLYNGGNNNSKQVRDLSMAIAFAFENGGKLSKIGTCSSNPLVEYFQRFSRGTMESGKLCFSKNSYSTYQVPTVSHIHINEIAKGVQNMNQILKACSDGLDLDRNSIEIGKELLKGAVNLEESLRVLVNLQEATKYTNGTQQKNRIRLLEEDDNDQDNSDATANQRQLDRPKFSFDKPTKYSPSAQRATKNDTQRHLLALPYLDEAAKRPVCDSKMVPHQRSVSCVPDFDSLSMQAMQRAHSSSPHIAQEKGRISNVVAKLMGLDELPLKDSPSCAQKELSTKPKERNEKDRKVSSRNPELPDPFNGDCKNGTVLRTEKTSPLTNNSVQIRDMKFNVKAEKIHEPPDGNSKLKTLARYQKTSKTSTVGSEAASAAKLGINVMNKQENHTIQPNQLAGFQTFQDKGQNQNFSEKEERKVSETGESYVLLLDNKLNQKAQQKGVFLENDGITGENIEFKARSNHLEKVDVKKDLASNHLNPQGKRTAFQIPESKKLEISEDKDQEVHKRHPKQNSTAKKHKGCLEESITSSKANQGPANLHKKQSHYKTKAVNGISTRLAENVSSKDPPHSMDQNDPPIVENRYTAAYQEVIKRKDQSHFLSPSEQKCGEAQATSNSTPMRTQEKPTTESPTQKKANSKKLQRSKNPQKIEVMAKRNSSVDGSPRSPRKSADLLQDLKQRLQNKSCSTKILEKQMDAQVREGKVDIMMHGSTEMKTEPSNQLYKLPKEADKRTTLSGLVEEDCQKQDLQNPLTLASDTSDGLASTSENVFNDLQKVEHLNKFRDEQEIKQSDQSSANLKESTVAKDLSQLACKQCSESWKQEQLTEAEKDLKETLIKSQLFLNAAEALFKLNIPLSFLHAGNPNDEVANKRLVSDCGYEVMNRKARRYQVTRHPYTNTTMKHGIPRSLDDLVKILCKDLEILKLYGGNGAGETDVAGYLYNILDKDIHNDEPDVNSTWDFEWNKMMYMFPEKEDVIKDVEKYMLNGLLDEISSDLLLVTV